MTYFLGIDIGTSSVKVAAFDQSGKIGQSSSEGYPMQHPQPGYSEQDPEQIANAVWICLRRVLDAMRPAVPELMAFSAAMHSIILMDRNDQMLTPCIIWADNRAGELARELRYTESGKYAYAHSGVPVHAMSPWCKVLWFGRQQANTLSAAKMIIGIKEYILYKLFGRYISDTSVASATGFMNLRSKLWDPKLLQLAGISADRLPELVSPRQTIPFELLPAMKMRFPELGQTRFIAGGSDGTLANLGTGCIRPGIMAVTIGTSSAARIALSQPYTDTRQRTFCYHAYDDLYIVGGAGNNGAVLLQWLKDSLLKTSLSYEELFEEAFAIAPGCEGLLCLPFILGERAPVWNSDLRGMFKGLDIRHGRAHLVRAVLEAVVFSVYSYGNILCEAFPVHEIRASGGFTQSPRWVQMLADMFNLPVCLVNSDDSSAWGAVMLGLPGDPASRPDPPLLRRFLPNSALHQVYQDQFRWYEKELRLLDEASSNHKKGVGNG